MNVRISLLSGAICVIAAIIFVGKNPLLKNYRGDTQIPDNRYTAYERLVVAFRKEDLILIEAICLPQAASAFGPSIVTLDDKPLLKDYHGNLEVPRELYDTYESLVKAFREADEKAIRSICLPKSIQISTKPRPDKTAEWGSEINLNFAKTQFKAQIINVRREADGVLLLQSATSFLYFIETKKHSWKVYRYGDAPIE